LSQIQKNQTDQSCFVHNNNCYLLYDGELLKGPEAGLLNRDIFQQATEYQIITTGGRGQAWFIEIDGLSTVYRRYMRGGLIARVNQQTYISPSLENTRSFKEWRMLQWMREKGLPVPRPVAASVCRWPLRFSPFYHAQILVERIPNVQTLDQVLSLRPLKIEEWHSIGQCICRFHREGIYHADLNANNILIDAESVVYLIDFDRGEMRSSLQKNTQWMQDNLLRLKRSLLKQRSIHKTYYYTEESWQALVDAYEM